MEGIDHWIGLGVTILAFFGTGAVAYGKYQEKERITAKNISDLETRLTSEIEKKADRELTESKAAALAEKLAEKTLELARDQATKEANLAKELEKRVSELNKDIDTKADKEHTSESFELLRHGQGKLEQGQIRQEGKLDQILMLIIQKRDQSQH